MLFRWRVPSRSIAPPSQVGSATLHLDTEHRSDALRGLSKELDLAIDANVARRRWPPDGVHLGAHVMDVRKTAVFLDQAHGRSLKFAAKTRDLTAGSG